MKIRKIKDIRYLEEKTDNYLGDFDGIIGNIYKKTSDTIYIGKRIARKLNELEFELGENDHLYINLSNKLKEAKIKEQDKFLDSRIKCYDYGINPSVFNSMTDNEKDKKINEITFEVLYWVCNKEKLNINHVINTEKLIEKFDTNLIINYKTKETNNYRIKLNFQIRPNGKKSKLIIEYLNKKENSLQQKKMNIFDYEDLYSLIDKVSVKDSFINLHSKKSYHSELVKKKYNNFPTIIEINKMEIINT